MAMKLKQLPADYVEKKKHWLKELKQDTSIVRIDKECHIWCGATSGYRRKYGRASICTQGKPFLISTHVLALFLEKAQVPDKGEDVSHLCHRTLCINTEHLKVEPHQINTQRRICKKRRKCCGHGSNPDCIFP